MHRALVCLIAWLAILTGSATAQDVPARLVPPPGSVSIGKYAASGVQIYICAALGSGFQWTLRAPEAKLVDIQNRPFADHYAGPTWEAFDRSKVVGRVLESAPAPRPGAIAWQLLAGESSGAGVLAGTRFIQRINTVGGLGPAGGCAPVNAERRVDFTADYVFFR